MSKTRRVEISLEDLEAERVELEIHLNEINKRNERFMADLAKLHDADIREFVENNRQETYNRKHIKTT